MPSENYNDILKEIQKTKAEAGQSQSYSENAGQTSGQTTQASGTGAAGNTGGGGCLIRNFGAYDKSRVTILDDICATAKGYESLAYMSLKRRG